MPLIKGFMRRIKRLNNGLDSKYEFFIACAEQALGKLGCKSKNHYEMAHIQRLKKNMLHADGLYHIKDIKFPQLDSEDENLLFGYIFEDTFASYIYFNDQYDEDTVNLCDDILIEGLYGLVNNRVNVTVESGDVVIDAGSWAGDFAAYASVKGAKVYAFEPTERIFRILERTAELNGNIIPGKDFRT